MLYVIPIFLVGVVIIVYASCRVSSRISRLEEAKENERN